MRLLAGLLSLCLAWSPAAFAAERVEPVQLRLPFGVSAADAAVSRLPELAGVKNLSDYRPPPQAAWIVPTAHFLAPKLLAGAAAVAGAGLGLLPVAAGAFVAHRLSPVRWSPPPEREASTLRGVDQERLRRRLDETAAALTRRLGKPPEDAPPVVLSNLHGPRNAWAGRGKLGFGDKWLDSDDRGLAGVMAHELGHQHHKDRGFGLSSPETAGSLLGFAVLLSAAAAVFSIALHALGAPDLLTGLARSPLAAASWACAAGAITWLSLAASGWGSRAQERRADHFAGWLLPPQWLASQFERWKQEAEDARMDWPAWKRARERLARLHARPLLSHPTHEARIRSLTTQAERGNIPTDR